MRKYATVPDWREYNSYKSVNCRLLYLHIALSMDCQTRDYVRSLRQLSDELSMPFQQLRTALKSLERDGLVVTQQATHLSTHRLTQRLTQQLTQIHLMSVSELDAASNAASNTASNTATNTATNTPPNTQKNNINNKNTESLPHTHAREHVGELKKLLEEEFSMGEGEAREFVANFLRRQELKGKTWQDVGDLKAHLVSWTEKHKRPKAKTRRTDTQARSEEYQRVEEEKKARSEEEKIQEELQTIRVWIADGERKLANAKSEEEKTRYTNYLAMQRSAYQEKLQIIKH